MMAGLLIKRREGQTVIIEAAGLSLVMHVEQVGRNIVSLNLQAAGDVHIFRGELFAAIHGYDVYEKLLDEVENAAGKCSYPKMLREGGGIDAVQKPMPFEEFLEFAEVKDGGTAAAHASEQRRVALGARKEGTDAAETSFC